MFKFWKRCAKPYRYHVNCVALARDREGVDSLVEMTQFSEETQAITWKTFLKNCELADVQDCFPFYSYRGETRNPRTGKLTCGFHIKDDWAVQFMTGLWLGQKIYYIVHSGIEYMFTEGGNRP